MVDLKWPIYKEYVNFIGFDNNTFRLVLFFKF